MGIEISKKLYDCVKDKMVSINSKSYAVVKEYPMVGNGCRVLLWFRN